MHRQNKPFSHPRPDKKNRLESRFNRGAWWVLASVSLFVLLVLWNTVAVLRLPGDGWQMLYDDRDTGNYKLDYFMGDWETPLRVGDVVTAVGDQPTPTTTQYVPLPAPATGLRGIRSSTPSSAMAER